MGRHGGGSRSGGSRGGGSRSGSSRSGRSNHRSSRVPFRGCYNRSWYDRRGRYHPYYTSDASFGTNPGGPFVTVIVLMITLHMCLMLSGFLPLTVEFGGKVSGDANRIQIVDNADILSDAEETSIFRLFQRVYSVSGMPVALYTDDFGWENSYVSIEAYSEELYYMQGYEEDAMVILFTTDDVNGFVDWNYDMYCGDDTIKCLSDASFDKLLDNFQKSMYQGNLAGALDYSWSSIMDEMAKTQINWSVVPFLLMMLAIYALFFSALLGSMIKHRTAYRYFQEHPEMLSMCPVENSQGESEIYEI